MDEQLRMVETLASPFGKVHGSGGSNRAARSRRPGAGNPWHIDDHTRQVGLEGVRQAREALRRTATRTAA